MTPMQLATAGYPIPYAALLLKANEGVRKDVAIRAMKEAYDALKIPIRDRLSAGLKKVACDELGLDYVRRSACAKKPIQVDAHGRGQLFKSVAPGENQSDPLPSIVNLRTLPKEWGIEEPNPLGRQVIEKGRSIFPGQTRANRSPLSPLRG